MVKSVIIPLSVTNKFFNFIAEQKLQPNLEDTIDLIKILIESKLIEKLRIHSHEILDVKYQIRLQHPAPCGASTTLTHLKDSSTQD